MNNIEFNTVGQMLFGRSWKKDMTRELLMSENSNTVAKIATGEVGITKGVEEDILRTLKRKASNLVKAAEQIENPEKILVTQTELSIVSFDVNGVQVLNVFEEHSAVSEFGILVNDADLFLNPQEYHFQSLLIAEYAKKAVQENNQAILINAINHYFDLRFFRQWHP